MGHIYALDRGPLQRRAFVGSRQFGMPTQARPASFGESGKNFIEIDKRLKVRESMLRPVVP